MPQPLSPVNYNATTQDPTVTVTSDPTPNPTITINKNHPTINPPNEFSNPEKMETDLLNQTYLQEEDYLHNGSVRVILKMDNTSNFQIQTADLNTNLIVNYPELSLIVVEIPYQELANLTSSPDITSVFLDRKVQCCDSSSISVIQPVNQWTTIKSQYGDLTGSGITIAILDTGIDATHPDLSFPNGTSKIIGSCDFTGSGSVSDKNGHGTHCASIAAGTGTASSGAYRGVATGAGLLNVKTMDNSGNGYSSWAINGIEWAVSQGADVLSLSFGTWIPSSDGSDPMSMAIDWATNQGVICCVAAGNSGAAYQSVTSPGCAKTAITVGACNNSGYVANMSGRGPTSDYRVKPDVVAPGVDIIAAKAAGTSSGWQVGQYYTVLSGTSMATPHVAGAVALIMQAHPSWTATQIKTAIMESANSVMITSKDDVLATGAGVLNVANAITVTTFASNTTLSFYKTLFASHLSENLTFSPTQTSLTFQTGESTTNLPLPLTYSSGQVIFTCPENTTAEWSSRLYVSGGCQFAASISLPIFTVTTYSPPSTSSWLTTNVVSTSAEWPSALAVAGDKLYVADAYYTGLIIEYSLPSMTPLRNLTLPHTMVNSIVISEGYLYAGTTYGFIYQIPLSTFTVQSQNSLPNNQGITKLLVANSKLYVTTYTGLLYKIDTTNLEIQSSKKIDNDIQSGAVANCNLYLLSEEGNLWKIDANTLEGTKINLGDNGFGFNSLIVANDYLYAMANNYPGKMPFIFEYFPQLFKISFDLNIVDRVSLGLPTSWSLALGYEGTKLYILAHYNTGVYYQTIYLLRVNLQTMEPDTFSSYTVNQARTPGFFAVQPFLLGEENFVVWSNKIITTLQARTFVLSEDLSVKDSLPTYLSSNVDSTRAGSASQITTHWFSESGLNGFIVGSNSSGNWVNQTLATLTGKYAAANYTFTVNNIKGDTVAWECWCQDTNGHWSNTGLQDFKVTSAAYYTLTMLPSEASGTNPTIGQHSYPDQTQVKLTVDSPTTQDYAFTNWIVDGEKQTANPLILTMDKDHTVKAEHSLTGATVQWEHFCPVNPSTSAPISSNMRYACSSHYAQTFTVGDTSHTVTYLKLYMRGIGTPHGPVIASIRAVSNGVPYGPDLANGTIDLSPLKTKPSNQISFEDWITVYLTYPTEKLVLQNNTQYAVVLACTTDVNSDALTIFHESHTSQFYGGQLYRLTGASVWQLVGEADELWPDDTMVFQVWGVTTNPNAPPPTPTPTATPTTPPTNAPTNAPSSTSSTSSSSSSSHSSSSKTTSPTPTPAIPEIPITVLSTMLVLLLLSTVAVKLKKETKPKS